MELSKTPAKLRRAAKIAKRTITKTNNTTMLAIKPAPSSSTSPSSSTTNTNTNNNRFSAIETPDESMADESDDELAANSSSSTVQEPALKKRTLPQ